MLGGTKTAFNLAIILLYNWIVTLPDDLLCLLRTRMFPAYVRPGFSHLPSQDLDNSLTHMFWSVPRWRCEGNPLKIFNMLSFFYAALSSLILYLANSIHLGLLKLSTLSQLRECWTLNSSFLNRGRKFFSWSWGNYRAHLICFPSPKDLFCLSSNIWKVIFQIFCPNF